MSNQQQEQATGWSTLPEVVPSEGDLSPGPQLLWSPDRELPEVIKVDEPKSSAHPDALPPPYPIPDEKTSWFRRRRKAIIIGAIIAVLAIVGIVVGVVVSQTQRNKSESSTTAEQTTPPSTTTDTPSQAQPAFGTPTTFPSSSSASSSTCLGAFCPQILASAQFATPPTTFLFARGTDNAIWVRTISSNGTWQTTEWVSLGGSFVSQPTAVSPRNGRVDVFAISSDGLATEQKTYVDGAGWDSSWRVVGGTCLSPPAVCSVGQDNIDVVVLGIGQGVAHKQSSNNGRSWVPDGQVPWENLEGWAASSPEIGCTTNSKGVRRMDVVVYGAKAAPHGMFYRRWNSSVGWDSGWNTDGWGDFQGDPVVVSGGGFAAYLGVAREDGAMWHRGWSEETGFWNGTSLGGRFVSVAAAFSTGTSRLDVLGVGTDGTLRHKARVDDVWSPWEDLGGFFNSAPKAVRPVGMDGRVVVFGVGPDGAIIHAVYTVGDKPLWGTQQWYSDGGVMSMKAHRAGPA